MRRFVDATNRRDYDGALAWYSQDAVLDMTPLGVGLFEGRDAIRGLFEDWNAAYEHVEQAMEEFRDLGNGVSFAVFSLRGRLGSGSVELRYACVTSWTDGLIERDTNYTDIDECRAAAERLARERGP